MGKRSRGLNWPVIVVLVVVMLLLAWYWTNSRAIHTQAAAIRAKGYPATPQELDGWYVEPPPDEDAAEVYEAAFKLNPNPLIQGAQEILPIPGEAELPPAGERLSPETLAAVDSYLESRRGALALFHEGAKRERARYPIVLADGFWIELPHLALVRGGVSLLELEAIARAEHGDAAGAVDSLVAAFRLVESLADEPELMSQMCRVTGHSIAVDGIGQVLCRLPLDFVQRDRLTHELTTVEQRNTFYRGLVGEQAKAVGLFLGGNPLYLDLGLNGLLEKVEGPVQDIEAGFLGSRDLRWFADSMGFLIQASRTTDRQQRMALCLQADRVPPWQYIRSSVLYPPLAHSIVAQQQDEARLRSARMALAVEGYRLDNGRLPSGAPDITPQYITLLPDDPFTEGPLRYVQSSGGYVVYSVGVDGADGGGVDPGQREGAREGDLVFHVVRPETGE